ncbi:MAG: pyridoxamine 5'-phosphate oxidase [Acidothermus cellulolyticus]|nr:pyridoxamine 5'-phosphate oxidase [Acidothermus cellulolyticus]
MRHGTHTGSNPYAEAYVEVTAGGLAETDLAADPIEQFRRWLADAIRYNLPEPTAMVVATADADGRPSSRHVLLKGVDDGFVFFTNYRSRKGRDLSENPWASLCFPWFAIGRQVVVLGTVTKVTREETAEYFASRPRDSQCGAWSSENQSSVVPSRAWLDERYAEVAQRFAGVEHIPPPPYWGGFRVIPETVEFWQARPARMHDRLRYRRTADGERPWIIERLSP